MNELRRMGNARAVVGMSRFGIQTETALGVSVPKLRGVEKKNWEPIIILHKIFGRLEFTKRASSLA